MSLMERGKCTEKEKGLEVRVHGSQWPAWYCGWLGCWILQSKETPGCSVKLIWNSNITECPVFYPAAQCLWGVLPPCPLEPLCYPCLVDTLSLHLQGCGQLGIRARNGENRATIHCEEDTLSRSINVNSWRTQTVSFLCILTALHNAWYRASWSI